ncbi:MAG: hypothetical protein JKY45_04780 [Emcibacter sp.]|nr:hypothetical protein [Emcibacter sp.]
MRQRSGPRRSAQLRRKSQPPGGDWLVATSLFVYRPTRLNRISKTSR